jgi:hypothetical protein
MQPLSLPQKVYGSLQIQVGQPIRLFFWQTYSMLNVPSLVNGSAEYWMAI